MNEVEQDYVNDLFLLLNCITLIYLRWRTEVPTTNILSFFTNGSNTGWIFTTYYMQCLWTKKEVIDDCWEKFGKDECNIFELLLG